MAGLQGRVLGGFQLTEQMSGGGIADVYRARPSKPGAREVVVKVIYPEFARQPGFLPRFREIVQSSGRLTSHPHILPLIASGEEHGYLYLVSPFVSAGALSDRMRSVGQLGPADVAPFFRQLCDALAYAHSLGVHHDNVKPSNIFLFEGRHVLLGDFGLLWNPSMMDLDQSASGTEAVEYLAPELQRGQGSQQADIYGVGAVLFAAVTGQAPFRGARPADIFAAHASQPPPHLAQVNAGLPAPILALDSVIQRAMAKRPEDRFPSAAAVAQAIESALEHAAPQVAARPNAPGSPQPPAGYGFAGQPMPGRPFQVEQPFPPNGFSGSLGIPVVSGPFAGPGFPQPLGSAPLGFGQLNPPFPPLPVAAAETARQDGGQPEIGALPTARMPAPSPAAAPTDGAGDLASLATLYSPAAQMGRVMIPESDGKDGQGTSDALHPQGLPAVRPGAGPTGQAGPMSNPGFVIAGGNATRTADNGGEAGVRQGQWSLTGPLGDDRFDNGTAQRIKALPAASGPIGSAELSTQRAAWQSSHADESSDGSGSLADWNGDGAESRGYPPFSGPLLRQDYSSDGEPDGPYTDEFSRARPAVRYDAGASHGNDRPFSPTQLDLPRLTNPAMSGMPPSWQDIVSGKHEAVRATRSPGDVPWSSSGSTQRDDWEEDSRAWQAQSTADGWEASRVGESMFAPAVGARGAVDGAASWGDDASAFQPSLASRLAQAPGKAEQEYQPFDDDRVWTTGHTAIKHKRRRRVRRLVLLLVLLLMFDMVALVVSRPDLCPSSGCRQLSGALHQRLPLLDRLTAPSALAVVASPSTVKLSVTAGQSAQTSVTVTNMGALATTEQVSSSLSWVNASPTSSALTAGANAQVTITAHPQSALKAGVYTATVTISNDKVSAVITITIAVNAAS